MEVVVVQVTKSLTPLARTQDLYVVIRVLADPAAVLYASACRLLHRLPRPTGLPQVARLAEPDPLPRRATRSSPQSPNRPMENVQR